MFGLERALSVPAWRVERVGDSAVLIQLTERLDASPECAEEIERARELAKKHLGLTAFYTGRPGEQGHWRAPEFTFDSNGPERNGQ